MACVVIRDAYRTGTLSVVWQCFHSEVRFCCDVIVCLLYKTVKKVKNGLRFIGGAYRTGSFLVVLQFFVWNSHVNCDVIVCLHSKSVRM